MGRHLSPIFLLQFLAFSTALAQSPIESQVEAWFEQEWADAQQMPDLGDGSFCWRVEFWDFPANPESELVKLRAQVEGRPDHPARQDIERIERALRGDAQHSRHCLWARDKSHWRMNSTYENGAYYDTAFVGKRLWRLTNNELIIASESTTQVVQQTMSTLYTFWPQINRFMFGGFSHGVISKMRPGTIQWDGREWRVTMSFGPENEPSLQTIISGRWDEEAGRGFVEREVIILSIPKPGTVGLEYRYSDWRFVEPLGRWVATKVEKRSPEGQPQRIDVFEMWHEGTPGDFDKVTATPSPDTNDPIREELSIVRLVDHRRGVVRERQRGESAFGNQIALEGTGEGGAWRNWLGWFSAAALGTGLVALFLKRRMTG